MREVAISMMYDQNLEEAISILDKGGTILFPTDTIWGIGCDACNAQAIQKIQALKFHDTFQASTLLVDSIEMLKYYVRQLHPKLETLMLHHVRPLTIVFDKV